MERAWTARISMREPKITAGFSRWRVIVPLLILLAITLWFGLTFYAASQWRRSEAATARANALRLAHLASDQQTRLIGETRDLLLDLAQHPVVRHRDPAACNAYLSALLTDNPDRYANLGVMKPDGAIVCSALPIRNSRHLAAHHHFRHAIEIRDFVIGPYEIDRRTGQAMLTTAFPVLDTAGRAHAVVFAELDLVWIRKLLAEAQLPQGAAFIVIDKDGTILAREPDPTGWAGKSALSRPSFRTILEQGKEGTSEGIGLDGNQRLFGYSPLITSWNGRKTYLVVAVTVAAPFAEFTRLLARQFVGLGLLVALAIVATWVVSDLVLRRRVTALVDASERLRLGDLGARSGLPYDRGKMGRLALAFDDMAAVLQARQAEAKQAETPIRRRNEALEQESRRIAHALHDDAGQLLAVVYIALDDCVRDLPPDAKNRLRQVKAHLDQVEEQLRRLSHELRPTILDNLGLVPALEFLADGVSKRGGLSITVHGGTEGRLPVPVETALYRCAQESLANVAKHAKATRVRIQLNRKTREIHCAIRDDGIGFDLPAVAAKTGDRGLGLIGIQERLKALDGALQITTAPGQGTLLLMSIPLEA